MEWATPEAIQEQPSAARPRFYTRQVEHKGKSLEAGRPIFVEHEYVEIRIAGDTKNIIDRKVQEKDKQRWPKQYQMFKAGKEQVLEGTPINQWISISATRALELQAVGVMTVEQLSEMPDGNLHMVGMDGMTLKMKAQAYIKTAKEAGYAERLAVQNKQMQDDLDFLKQKMTPLLERLDQMETELNTLKGDNHVTETTGNPALYPQQRPAGQ